MPSRFLGLLLAVDAVWKGQRLWVPPWGHSYRGYRDSGHLMDHSLICGYGSQWAALTASALARPAAVMKQGWEENVLSYSRESVSQTSACVHTDFWPVQQGRG